MQFKGYYKFAVDIMEQIYKLRSIFLKRCTDALRVRIPLPTCSRSPWNH